MDAIRLGGISVIAPFATLCAYISYLPLYIYTSPLLFSLSFTNIPPCRRNCDCIFLFLDKARPPYSRTSISIRSLVVV